MENGQQQQQQQQQPQQQQPQQQLTYAEAFPPLMGNSATGPPQSSWVTAMKPIPSSTVTQIFHIPLEERRFQLKDSFGDQQSEVVRHIMERTGCSIELSFSKDLSLTIIVSGKPAAVGQARRELLTKMQTQAHLDLKIPKVHHKNILGKQGAKLKKIEFDTATKVAMPRSEDSSDIIQIIGTKEGVERARHSIQLISDQQAKLAHEVLDIDCEYHPFINGELKRISEQTGARINIPPMSLKKNELSVAGAKESVAEATDQIMKIVAAKKKNCQKVNVEVKKSQHKYIVGPRWQGIQDILQSTGVWVEVPSTDSDSNTITLHGPQEKLGAALTQVYEKANSVACEKVHAPGWLHRFIIGRKGQNVQKITQDLTKVHVEFNSEKDMIVLEGPPTEVSQAKEAFETFTEDLMATMDFAEVEIDQKYHRHIIGKGGSSVNRIKTETGTSIIIPPDTDKSSVIRIEGDPKGVAAAKSMLLSMAAKMENERTKDLVIEQRFHKHLIGSKGEKIREIRDRFNGIQVGFPETGEKRDIVTLRGPKEDVEKCAAHLKKMAAELDAANYQEKVKVFKQFHGSIVGKGGATLRKIREETQTKIDLPTESSDSDLVVITGLKANVQKAKKMILDIEKEMATITDVTIEIPHRLHNAIIGPKGKLVQSVMEECGGVKIHFPSSDSKSDKVDLHGPKDDVERAKKMLLELADEHAQNNYVTELRCKQEYHRFLIGRGGANIRKVKDKFGARVIFPQRGSRGEDVESITIIGQREKAEEAKAHLMKLIKDLDNVVEDELHIDPKYHRNFVMRRGQLIREVSEENGGVIISFPHSDRSDKVVLKGAKQCIEGAKTRILEIVADLEAQVTIECVIDHKHHRNILGSKGANVQAITQAHNVSIKFPNREQSAAVVNGDATTSDADPRDIIYITGRSDAAALAKQALLDLIPVEIKVPVPYEFHRYIIGQHGQEIRSLMSEYDVNITVPQSEDKVDLIKVTGVSKNCEDTRKALERRVQQLEAEKEERELRSYSATIHVSHHHHPNIIGRKGSRIQAIREEFDVWIRLPGKGDANADEIVLTGYEHQVKACQDKILSIVQELEEQVHEEVEIDHRVHRRLIGVKGKNIAKVMEKYKVDIRFPRDKQSNIVEITGAEENVEDAKYHLLTLTDDYMQDVYERESEEELKRQYTHPQMQSNHSSRRSRADDVGFVVKDAPWSANLEEFPAIGSSVSSGDKGTQWGPSASGPRLPPT